jgi:hypothetical protein
MSVTCRLRVDFWHACIYVEGVYAFASISFVVCPKGMALIGCLGTFLCTSGAMALTVRTIAASPACLATHIHIPVLCETARLSFTAS